jgi:hypothetical protein
MSNGNFINRIKFLTIEKQKILLDKLAPLSESQKRIFTIEKNIPELNNITLIPLIISNRIHIQTLENTVNLITQKHEILRTVFVSINNLLRQLVLPQNPVKLSIPDSNQAYKEEEIQKLISNIESERFILENEFLWKCKIYELQDSKTLAIFAFHQTIFDGFSLNLFLNELLSLRNSINQPGLQNTLTLKIQYGDYAKWQQKKLDPDYLFSTSVAWKSKLLKRKNTANLIAQYPRPNKSLCKAAEFEFEFSESQTGLIGKFCSLHKITFPMLGAAILAITLYKTTKMNNATIGIPIAGRTLSESEFLIGSFVNIAPLIITVESDKTISDLLLCVKDEMLFIQENQEFPFQKLLEIIYPDQLIGNYGARNSEPLLRIFLDYKGKTAKSKSSIFENEFSIFDSVEKKTGCDLYLKLSENPKLNLSFLFNAEIFSDSEISKFINLYKTFLIIITENSNCKIADFIDKF